MPNTKCTPQLKMLLMAENHKAVAKLKAAIKNRGIKKKDYAAVAVACEYNSASRAYREYGHSSKCHSSIQKKVIFVPPLYTALTKFGKVPTVNCKIKLFVGTCAEDFAANEVMCKYSNYNHGNYPKLKDLVFTEPIRMRTFQQKDFCNVCKAIF